MELGTRRSPSNAYRENNVSYSSPPQATMLKPQQLDEIIARGL